jgi:hypothetical protein
MTFRKCFLLGAMTLALALPALVSCGKPPDPKLFNANEPPGDAIDEEEDTSRTSENAFDDAEPAEAFTEYAEDLRAGRSRAETIYFGNLDELDQAAYYYPYEEEYDAGQKSVFIENYLRRQGVEDAPSGVAYNAQGNPLAEYYIPEDDTFCFVIHFWDDYLLNPETRESVYTDIVYCATFRLREHDKAGNILYDLNPEGEVARERLYDAQGRRTADVSYEYVSGFPFPFVTDYWDADADSAPLSADLLCRNQKMWFDKNRAQFDASGRFIGYEGGGETVKEFLSYSCTCVYDAGGNIDAILEDMPERVEKELERMEGADLSDRLSGSIAFDDRENGNIRTVEYLRDTFTHGTTDSSGKIYYDEAGRMIRNAYYITHGRHNNIFLYEKDSKRPWACLYWCNFGNGFEDIHLFLPESEPSL